jgi:transposase
VKRQKNDAADAEAICEAASRQTMRSVPVKSEEQQSLQAVHRIRTRLVRDRTALVNEIRGLLAEFGLVFPCSIRALRAGLCELLSNETDDVPALMRSLLVDLARDLEHLDRRIAETNDRLDKISAETPICRMLMTIPGVGRINASAAVAMIGDVSRFRRGRDLAAWLGLAPRQRSSGGKERLGSISKKGNAYLRTTLVHGARAYVRPVRRRQDRPRTLFERWIVEKLASSHVNVVIVAVANKLARFLWAVMRTGQAFVSPPLRAA